jgi:hypothetical protein
LSGGDGSNLGGSSATFPKRGTLLIDPNPSVICLGAISSSKFCIKPLTGGKGTCGAAAHMCKFQSPNFSAFLKENEIRAYCTPAFDLSPLSPAQHLRIQGIQFSVEEWNQLFDQVTQGVPPKWLTFGETLAPMEVVAEEAMEEEILSPSHAAAGSLMGLIPALSSESVTSSDSVEETVDVPSYIHQFCHQFSALKGKWI